MKVLVTGTAGFIGSHVSHRLLDRGDTVVGVDNLNPYYDVKLKEARLARLTTRSDYDHERIDIADRAALHRLLSTSRPDRIVHLATGAMVNYWFQY